MLGDDIRASLAGKEFPGMLRVGWIQVGLRWVIRTVQVAATSDVDGW